MTVFGYIFIDPEKKYLLPVNKQQYMIEEYGRSLGHQVENFFIEQHVSARRPFAEREEAGALLHLCRGNDLIIVARQDLVFCKAGQGLRLIRLLQERDISLHLIDLDGDIVRPTSRKLVISNGISGLVVNLLETLAQRERPVHGAAIRRAKQVGKNQGRYLGGPVAFGYQVNEDGGLIEHQQEQKIIKKIVKMRRQNCSYRDIARILAEKHEISLSHEGVRKIIARQEKKAKA